MSRADPHDICRIPPNIPFAGATAADLTDRFNWSDDFLRGGRLPRLPGNFNAPRDPALPPTHGGAPEDWDEAKWRRFLGVYHLLIENTDHLFGQALAALDRAGLAEETLVVFTSDHGDHAAAHGLVGKGSFYEESARVLLVLRFPGKVASGRRDRRHCVSGVDLLPTIADYAGIDLGAAPPRRPQPAAAP